MIPRWWLVCLLATAGPAQWRMVKVDCSNGVDRIVGRSGNTYYACVGGKWVEGPRRLVPSHLADTFDAKPAHRIPRLRAQLESLEASDRRNDELWRKGFLQRETYERSKANIARQKAEIESELGVSGGVPLIPAATSSGPARPVRALPESRLTEVAAGDSMDQVLAKLGQPSSRVMGDMVRLSYLLDSGQTAKLEFEAGKLSRIVR